MRVIRHKRTKETRSILEARWALFFRELGLKFKYEPKKLKGKGCSYTPDFHVEGLGYVEIKPTLELFISETADRIKSVALSNPELEIYIFCGGRVEFGRVALYRGDKIFAPSAEQMMALVSRCRAGAHTLSVEARFADIQRAMAIANTTRFSEWRNASDILKDVISELGGRVVG